MSEAAPSLEDWLAELKSDSAARGVGMYLAHNGVVRATTRSGAAVSHMELTADRTRLAEAIAEAERMPGIAFVRAWINEGTLEVGDDIMKVLVGGDIREHVFGALQALVRTIKSDVVVEREEP